MKLPIPKLAFQWTLIAAAGAIGLAAGLAGQSGCASNCGTNCPPNTIYVGVANPSTQAVPYFSIRFDGPACQSSSGYCLAANTGQACSYFTVTGLAEGDCDVYIGFTDRPPEVLHLQFGPHIQQGCCAGYQIIGPDTYIIPTDPNGVIYGVDGGADVTVYTDGGTDGTTD